MIVISEGASKHIGSSTSSFHRATPFETLWDARTSSMLIFCDTGVGLL